MENPHPIEIFQTDDGRIRLEVQLKEETVWLAQAQLVMLFERDQSVISRHVSNIFKEGELNRQSNMQKMHIAGSDKPVTLYNLDVIISVGYRVKSQRGVQFRQWATQTLKQHLIQGYTLNHQRMAQLGADVEQLMGLMPYIGSPLCRRQQAHRLVPVPALPAVPRPGPHGRRPTALRGQRPGGPGPADRRKRTRPEGTHDPVDSAFDG